MPGARAEILPFNVITGFLGAGKTTLLNALLKHPDMGEALVIVNEFGEVGLDHLLVEAAADEVIELASGCLCCALRGDLVDTLVRVLQERDAGAGKPFARIVVETSGLADPAPIVHSIMAHPWLMQRLSLDGMVTVVDALSGEETLKAHQEGVKQVALAERLVISKADMLAEDEREKRLDSLRQALRAINPGADILLGGDTCLAPRELFHAGLRDPLSGEVHLDGWLRVERLRTAGKGAHDHHHHGAQVESFALVHDAALSPAGLDIFIDLLRASFGAALLRVKGIVKLADDPSRPVVVHGVQHVFHPPARLDAWPDDERTTRLVFITRVPLREKIEALFAAISDPLTGAGAARADDTLSVLPGGDG